MVHSHEMLGLDPEKYASKQRGNNLNASAAGSSAGGKEPGSGGGGGRDARSAAAAAAATDELQLQEYNHSLKPHRSARLLELPGQLDMVKIVWRSVRSVLGAPCPAETFSFLAQQLRSRLCALPLSAHRCPNLTQYVLVRDHLVRDHLVLGGPCPIAGGREFRAQFSWKGWRTYEYWALVGFLLLSLSVRAYTHYIAQYLVLLWAGAW
eukprot:SAG22_NODE_1436_length_4421_cov_9.840583_4_plen_208_part_00